MVQNVFGLWTSRRLCPSWISMQCDPWRPGNRTFNARFHLFREFYIYEALKPHVWVWIEAWCSFGIVHVVFSYKSVPSIRLFGNGVSSFVTVANVDVASLRAESRTRSRTRTLFKKLLMSRLHRSRDEQICTLGKLPCCRDSFICIYICILVAKQSKLRRTWTVRVQHPKQQSCSSLAMLMPWARACTMYIRNRDIAKQTACSLLQLWTWSHLRPVQPDQAFILMESKLKIVMVYQRRSENKNVFMLLSSYLISTSQQV